LKIVKRILRVLYEKGKQNRTNLSLNSHLNYDSCIKYLQLMKSLDLIIINKIDDGFGVNLTEKGRWWYIKNHD